MLAVDEISRKSVNERKFVDHVYAVSLCASLYISLFELQLIDKHDVTGEQNIAVVYAWACMCSVYSLIMHAA